MDTVISLLTGLSDSQVRAFRHTSTLAGKTNCLCTWVCTPCGTVLWCFKSEIFIIISQGSTPGACDGQWLDPVMQIRVYWHVYTHTLYTLWSLKSHVFLCLTSLTVLKCLIIETFFSKLSIRQFIIVMIIVISIDIYNICNLDRLKSTTCHNQLNRRQTSCTPSLFKD